MEDRDWQQDVLNKRISLSSKVGVSVSLALVVIGLILIGLSGESSGPLLPVSQLPQAILNLNPAAIITIAVLILLFTPVSLIIIALVTLAIERNRIYSGICLLLLCILIVSIIVSLA
jgi:uncharacterized membrane protein